jgi:hypothetical protein
MTRWLCVLVLALAPACVAADKPAVLPDFAPSIMRVVNLKASPGVMLLRSYQIEEQDVQTLSTGGGGGTVLKVEKVYGPTRKDRYVKVEGCKFLEASGKEIKKDDLGRRLKPGAVVLLTNDGKLPAKAFLALLKPETIIIVPPAAKLDPRITLPEEKDPPK